MPSPPTALLLAMLALATAGLGAHALVPRVGDAMGKKLARLAAVLPSSSGSPAEPTEVADVMDPIPSPAEEPPVESLVAGRGHAASRPRARKGTADAVDIPADRLAHVTEKQLRSLRATNAVDKGGRAIGAVLHGVGALGLGLADGDVVTSIDGGATPDVATATAAAMRAYASGEAAAHATVLRNGRTLLVTVHIPPSRTRRAS